MHFSSIYVCVSLRIVLLQQLCRWRAITRQSPFHMLFLVSHFWKHSQAHTSRNMLPHPLPAALLWFPERHVSRERVIGLISDFRRHVPEATNDSLSHKAIICSFILSSLSLSFSHSFFVMCLPCFCCIPRSLFFTYLIHLSISHSLISFINYDFLFLNILWFYTYSL